MKKIDTTSPLFGQIEKGDNVYYFNSNLEIKKVPVTDVYDEFIVIPWDIYESKRFKVNLLSNATISYGNGIATSKKAAYDCLNKHFHKELESYNKEVEKLSESLNGYKRCITDIEDKVSQLSLFQSDENMLH